MLLYSRLSPYQNQRTDPAPEKGQQLSIPLQRRHRERRPLACQDILPLHRSYALFQRDEISRPDTYPSRHTRAQYRPLCPFLQPFVPSSKNSGRIPCHLDQRRPGTTQRHNRTRQTRQPHFPPRIHLWKRRNSGRRHHNHRSELRPDETEMYAVGSQFSGRSIFR